MNLLYFGDITSRPALTEEYYSGLFCNDGSFIGQQTKCRAMGADYCEVEVTPAT